MIDYFCNYGILKSDQIVTIYSVMWRTLMVAHAISLIVGSYYAGVVDLVSSWHNSLVGSKKNSSVCNQRKRQ